MSFYVESVRTVSSTVASRDLHGLCRSGILLKSKPSPSNKPSLSCQRRSSFSLFASTVARRSQLRSGKSFSVGADSNALLVGRITSTTYLILNLQLDLSLEHRRDDGHLRPRHVHEPVHPRRMEPSLASDRRSAVGPKPPADLLVERDRTHERRCDRPLRRVEDERGALPAPESSVGADLFLE